ncbi:MAG: fibronectin type III domain-containing protein [Prosthecobacter sp.]|uniref:hypothetical protein n=1 Tax=Prosthecobacter sp. TaxID=1965333 RepID=UPI0019E56B01|nr:hypothetical protein [Prosthecobacter sp.]MBE2283560.1 fibronectin type III domain-containing protein [Prosthecobacter sp.]
MLCALYLFAPLRLNRAFVMLLSLFAFSAQAAVRSGGPYEVQNEAVGIAGGSAAGGVYGHEMALGGVAGVSSVSGVVSAQGYIAQKVPLTGPEVVLGLPTGFSTVDMTLNGYVNPRGLATTAVFEYGTTTSYGSSASVTLSPNNGTSTQSVSAVLPGLAVNTVYHYRLSATNAEGTNRTDDGTFIVTITAQAPVVTAQAASEVGIDSAKLNGQVNPNGYAATSSFEISTNGTSWTPIAAQPSPLTGSVAVGVIATATGLLPNTTYQCRLRSTNAAGTSTSSVITFATNPDPPGVIAANPTSISATSATLAGSVLPKNRATTVWFEYGTSTAYGTNTPVQNIPVGSAAVDVTAPISGLTSGVTYHYRMVAANIGGTVPGSNVSFVPVSGITPTAAPSVTSGSAFVMSLDLVLVIGTVNPNGGPTTLRCEYGTTPALGSQTVATPAGNTNTTQLALVSIESLLPGTQYHYRLVAQNSLGTTASAISTFTSAYPPPEAVTGSSTALSTTSVQVLGSVRARHAATQVFFDYGTDGTTFPNSLSAVPAVLSSDVMENVSATLTNLQQGTTYYYRVRAVSSGGTTTGLTSSFQVSLLSGLLRQSPTAPPSAAGTLTVNLTPANLLTGWRFVGEQSWRASGSTATGLTTRDREIEFRPVPGHIHPPGELIASSETDITRDYYDTSTSGSGGLIVLVKPAGITTGANRAQWRLLGESDAQWRDSSDLYSGLVPGSYLIECKPVPGRATPPNTNVIISDGQTAAPTITYFLADSSSGAAPSPLSFASISTDTAQPSAHVGQLRSDAGVSSGFVVKPRVIATAAHVVWDDGTLSTVKGLQWLFQRHAAVHEPRPITPRGFYLFDGYAAQRVIDNSPGDSTPQSQNLDVAAIYLNETAARDGFSGYLASDLAQNEHLLSSADKMLVGYPVDGIAPAFQGIMHATTAFNVVFTAGYGRTFTTTGIRSSGGNSGGPLCVRHTNGAWYPTAVYLGGNNQTVVRAIDSSVIELFTRAEVSGNGGADNTGGGITQTSYTTIASGSAGALKVIIEPSGARNAGAGWRLSPESTYRASGATKSALSPGSYVIQFTTVADFDASAQQNVIVTAGQLNSVTFTYATPQESWRQAHFSTTANTGNAADNADPDGDGFTNAAEYAAGTNPTLSGDFLKATAPARSGETFTLSTAGKAGRTYYLERSNNLTTWFTVTSDGPVSADGQVTLTDPSITGGAAFYRIRVTGPAN